MTERLYYDNALLFEFDAQVTACRMTPAGCQIALDRSAFYPTSGGQPFDTGVLQLRDGRGVCVMDVNCDDAGEVWHTCEEEMAVGTQVHGLIDRERRLDHMEQHGGEHMLAGAVWRHFGGVTIGLHTGEEDATIDVMLPDGRTHLTAEEIRLLESDVNGHIRANAPVRCWFPDEEELKTLPLRKAPAVDAHVRVVQMGDFEYCACGGTHPPYTGMIGMVKILSVTPAKGKARVRFVCGKRAQQKMAEAYESAKEAGEMLSCGIHLVPGSIENLKKRIAELQKEKSELAEKLAHYLVADARKNAQTDALGRQIVTLLLPPGDRKTLMNCAQELIAESNTVALCAMPGEKGGVQVIFARSADAEGDMNALLRAAGCRGGGKQDFVQGSAEQVSVLERAKMLLLHPEA